MGKHRETCQKDLLRPALEQIIDLGHPLAREIDWDFLVAGSARRAGLPGLPLRPEARRPRRG